MIKRYGHGQKSIRVGHRTNINIPDLVEREDGDYVRYEDYVAAMEGTQKPLDQHRLEFEMWLSQHGMSVTKTTDCLYMSHTVGWAWQAWLASKGINT